MTQEPRIEVYKDLDLERTDPEYYALIKKTFWGLCTDIEINPSSEGAIYWHKNGEIIFSYHLLLRSLYVSDKEIWGVIRTCFNLSTYDSRGLIRELAGERLELIISYIW